MPKIAIDEYAQALIGEYHIRLTTQVLRVGFEPYLDMFSK